MTCHRKWYATVLAPLLLLTPARASAQDLPPPPVDMAAVVRYMETLPPETLIRIAFADTPDAERMVAIARRESHFDCSADNPSSSASGLFQLMGFWADAHGWWPGVAAYHVTWEQITGPSCVADVVIARAIYDHSGLAPWRL